MAYTHEYSGRSYTYGDRSFTTNWKITSIPGLVLWLEPSQKSTLTDGEGRVHEWRDSSGLSNHARQVTQSLKPLMVRTSVNGHNYVYFDDDKILSTKLNLSNFTIFTVNLSNDDQYVYQYGDATDQSGFHLNGDVNSISVRSGSTISTKSAGAGWNTTGTWRTLVHYYSGTHASHVLRVNNVGIFLENYLNYTGSPGTLQGGLNMYIGGQPTGSGFNGGIAEFIVFDRKIESHERDMVQDYINGKYNL